MLLQVTTKPKSGMTDVCVNDEAQNGDSCEIKLTDGRTLDVVTDPEFQAVHLYDEAGIEIGYVTFDELFELAASR